MHPYVEVSASHQHSPLLILGQPCGCGVTKCTTVDGFFGDRNQVLEDKLDPFNFLSVEIMGPLLGIMVADPD
ncbi:Beta-fructofuranosidase, insoluble isoenzyme CWINV4 [Senna tora]|uniref:Beta-fructofuranosidase, insoluble isoenzyme CWINV4 n=1 Tax=Senna tora TaxID=362788 RepID=A0A834W5X6_9FABA|nr:Beta-fructofuranosidase, insoluble isoenzyme CWINV4 [Senna tora]